MKSCQEREMAVTGRVAPFAGAWVEIKTSRYCVRS